MGLQDGPNVYNTPGILTISGLTFVVESVSVDSPTNGSTTYDGDNKPNSTYHETELKTLSFVLQATALTSKPEALAVFAYDIDGGTPTNWKVTSVGEEFSQGEAVKFNLEAQEAITVTP